MITEPMLIVPICKTDTWGGTNVTKMFNIQSPYEKTSEVWVASALEYSQTTVKIRANEKFSFDFDPSYLYSRQQHIFGKSCKKYKKFPLLAKWIDANDNLSVQVHPDNERAKKEHSMYGKTEAWYIVSAKPGAKIVYGLKPGTRKDDLIKALSENKVETVLNFVPVTAGEIYYIPAGMVHALLDGIIVYEIQQSSDITYRLYDWGRKNEEGNPLRPLKTEQALEAINYDKNDSFIKYGLSKKDSKSLTTPYFKFSVCKSKRQKSIWSSAKSFKLCSVLNGNLKISVVELDEEIIFDLKPGDSFILPAAYREKTKYKIKGEGTFLVSSAK